MAVVEYRVATISYLVSRKLEPRYLAGKLSKPTWKN